MLSRLLVLFLPPLLVLAVSSPYQQCFDRYSRRAIANSEPISVHQMVSLTTCMHYCFMASTPDYLCASFVYDTDFHNCRLYSHDGYQVPAIVHPALSFDYYARNFSSSYCRSLVAEGNPNFAHLRRGPHSEIQQQHQAKTAKNDITNFRTHDEGDNRDEFSRRNFAAPIQKRAQKIPISSDASADDQDLVQTLATSTSPKTDSSERKEKGQTGYYVVLGTEILKGDDTNGLVQVLSGVEQGECASLCSANVGLEQAHFDCKSLNYYPATRKCELYSIQVEPNGPGKFLANPNTIYSEKFTIPRTKRICQNDEVFILHVQKVVTKQVIAVESASGITPCLSLCLASDQCKSAVYNDERQQCSLHAVDIGLHPSALEDTQPGSVVIENACSGRAIVHGVRTHHVERQAEPVEDAEWSSCSFKVDGVKVKVREASSGLKVRRC